MNKKKKIKNIKKEEDYRKCFQFNQKEKKKNKRKTNPTYNKNISKIKKKTQKNYLINKINYKINNSIYLKRKYQYMKDKKCKKIIKIENKRFKKNVYI